MADPTTPVVREVQAHMGISKAKIVSAEVLVPGAFAAEIYGNGEIQNAADEANAWPTGIVQKAEEAAGDGLTSDYTGTALDTEADKGVTVRGDLILKDATVTGVDNYNDKGKPVYATDGQTLTITRPSDDAVPCGFVWDKVRDSTDTTCDVYFFSKFTSWLFGVLGGNVRTFSIGYVPLGTSAGAQITALPIKGHGKIIGARAVVLTPPTNDTKITTVNFEINGTDTTGGVITLDADAIQTKGAVVEASAFTALNEFHDGDVIDMESATSGTHLADGVFAFFLDIEYLPGA